MSRDPPKTYTSARMFVTDITLHPHVKYDLYAGQFKTHLTFDLSFIAHANDHVALLSHSKLPSTKNGLIIVL